MLDSSERESACRAFWESNTDMKRQVEPDLVEALRRSKGFNKDKAITGKPTSWKVKNLRMKLSTPRFHCFIRAVLFEYILARKMEMVAFILDAEGTPHQNGMLGVDAPVPTIDVLVKGLEAASSVYAPKDLLLYYGFQLCFGAREHWTQLPAAFEHPRFQELCAKALGENLTKEASCRDDDDDEDEQREYANPEYNEEFTVLDNLIIKTIVAGAQEVDGALDSERLEDLVAEILALNVDRHRSYFHLGFFHAMQGNEIAASLSASNFSRRGWYLTGYVKGLLRCATTEEVIAFIRANQKAWKEFLTDGPPPARAMLLEPMVRRFLEVSDLTNLKYLLESSPFLSNPLESMRVYGMCYEHAAALVRTDRHREVFSLLEVLEKKLRNDPSLDNHFRSEFVSRCYRKLGQAELRSGRFPQATNWLTKSLANPAFSQSGNVHADLGLSEAGFRSLKFMLPRKDEHQTQNEAVIQALERTKAKFLRAIEQNNATNAHFVLGWIATYRGELDKSEEYLTKAYEGMLAFEETYQTDHLVDWVRLFLAIVVAETCEDARLNEIRGHVERVVASPESFPLYLWQRLCNALAAYDDTSVLEVIIAHLLKKRGSAAYALLRQSGLLHHSQELRIVYANWLRSEKTPPKDRARDLEALLRAAIANASWDEATEFLDALEGVVKSDNTLIPGFIDLLRDHRSELLTVWDELDLDLTTAALWEQVGDIPQSAASLQSIFWRARSEGNEEMVEAILEHLSHLHVPDLDIGHLRSQVVHLTRESSKDLTGFSEGPGIRVLYVGGNEIQIQYEQKIKNYLQVNAPSVDALFYYPGWDSNWNIHLEKVLRELPTVHVVVLNNLVRTQFGRSLRRECGSNGNPPWLPCTGRGEKSIRSAILNAAGWVRSGRME
jgi:tetratricopeptide (TPR) repeat protein